MTEITRMEAALPPRPPSQLEESTRLRGCFYVQLTKSLCVTLPSFDLTPEGEFVVQATSNPILNVPQAVTPESFHALLSSLKPEKQTTPTEITNLFREDTFEYCYTLDSEGLKVPPNTEGWEMLGIAPTTDVVQVKLVIRFQGDAYKLIKMFPSLDLYAGFPIDVFLDKVIGKSSISSSASDLRLFDVWIPTADNEAYNGGSFKAVSYMSNLVGIFFLDHTVQ